LNFNDNKETQNTTRVFIFCIFFITFMSKLNSLNGMNSTNKETGCVFLILGTKVKAWLCCRCNWQLEFTCLFNT